MQIIFLLITYTIYNFVYTSATHIRYNQVIYNSHYQFKTFINYSAIEKEGYIILEQINKHISLPGNNSKKNVFSIINSTFHSNFFHIIHTIENYEDLAKVNHMETKHSISKRSLINLGPIAEYLGISGTDKVEANKIMIYSTKNLAKENSLKIHQLIDNLSKNFAKLNKYLNMEDPDILELYSFLIQSNHIIQQMSHLLLTIKDIYDNAQSGTLSILAMSKRKLIDLVKKNTNLETSNFIEKLKSEIFEINWDSKLYIKDKLLTLSFLIPRIHKHSLCLSNNSKISNCHGLSVLLTSKPKVKNTKNKLKFYQQKSCFYNPNTYHNCLNIRNTNTYMINKKDNTTSFCHLNKGHSKSILQIEKSVKMKIHTDTSISCPGLKIYKASNTYIHTENILELYTLNSTTTKLIHKHVKLHLSPPVETKNIQEQNFNWTNSLKHNFPSLTIIMLAATIYLLWKLKNRINKQKNTVIDEAPL